MARSFLGHDLVITSDDFVLLFELVAEVVIVLTVSFDVLGHVPFESFNFFDARQFLNSFTILVEHFESDPGLELRLHLAKSLIMLLHVFFELVDVALLLIKHAQQLVLVFFAVFDEARLLLHFLNERAQRLVAVCDLRYGRYRVDSVLDFIYFVF